MNKSNCCEAWITSWGDCSECREPCDEVKDE